MTNSPPETRVLVVEDEQDLADLYSDWLADSYAVRTAYGGRQALDLLEETVDVVLLDRRMPHVAGSGVLDEIREQGYDCRIAMVTAVEPDLDIVQMGFDDYLTKPVSKEKLLATVDRLLSLATYDDRLKEYYAVASKKAALDARSGEDEFGENDEYAALAARLAALEVELSETAAGLDRDDRSHSVFALLRGSNRNEDSTDEIPS